MRGEYRYPGRNRWERPQTWFWRSREMRVEGIFGFDLQSPTPSTMRGISQGSRPLCVATCSRVKTPAKTAGATFKRESLAPSPSLTPAQSHSFSISVSRTKSRIPASLRSLFALSTHDFQLSQPASHFGRCSEPRGSLEWMATHSISLLQVPVHSRGLGSSTTRRTFPL